MKVIFVIGSELTLSLFSRNAIVHWGDPRCAFFLNAFPFLVLKDVIEAADHEFDGFN